MLIIERLFESFLPHENEYTHSVSCTHASNRGNMKLWNEYTHTNDRKTILIIVPINQHKNEHTHAHITESLMKSCDECTHTNDRQTMLICVTGWLRLVGSLK